MRPRRTGMRLPSLTLLVVLTHAFAAAGCTNKLTPPAADTPVPMIAVTPDSVQSIFSANCALPGCHLGPTAPFGERLDAGFSYAAIVGVPSGQQPSLLRIDPGDAAASYLLRKLDGGPAISGQQMPLGGEPLPDSVRDVIRNWANQGALPDSVPAAPEFVATH